MKKKNDKFKLIIFDFDGTIADSFDLCFESINHIIKDLGKEEITEKEKQEARNLSAKEIFQYFKIPNYQLPFVVRKILNVMETKFDKVGIFTGMKSVLRDLKKDNFKIVLLTSNIEKSVKKLLEKEKMDKYFDDLYFKSRLFSKHLMIRRIATRHKLKRDQIIIIGDEVRDIEAARKSRIKIAAVSWGYNSKKILANNNPDYLLDKPSEILDIIKNKS